MANGSILTEEMRKAIGTETRPITTEVEKGAIVRFAEAIGDPNPLYNDEVQARKSRYGGIIAPPTFLRSVGSEELKLPFDLPLSRLLDGGSEWEYLEPVRPGDTIKVVTRLADLYERAGRLGPMVFIVSETVYTNQFDQAAAKQRTTLIRY